LKQIYRITPKDILEIIDYIYYVGTTELYGKIVENGKDSLKYMNEIIIILENNNIKLPNLGYKITYSIIGENGWGYKFTREELIKDIYFY
jgi:hypothetical protein